MVWQSAVIGTLSTENFSNEPYVPVAGQNLAPWDAVIATRQSDLAFLNYLNNWIRKRILDNCLKTRHEYWFGGRLDLPWQRCNLLSRTAKP